ncbi:uncharacterized protein LJ206_000684 [Theristicus caerulescens]
MSHMKNQEIASAAYEKFEHLESELTAMDGKMKQLQLDRYCVTPAAAAPVRGSGLTAPAPLSPPQRVESMATELEERCPICLGSWEEPSHVMPCLHRFCYPCILRWAESKPECPLCKRRILSILHSVRADDDYKEHVITSPVTPPVIVRQAGQAPRHPTARNLHHPAAPQRWAAQGVPRRPVAVLQPPNWLNTLQSNLTLFQTLQHWVHQEQEELFGNRVVEAATVEDTTTGTPTSHGVATELGRARVAVQRRSREAHCLPGWQDARAAGGPARSSVDELPGTSSAAVGGGPGSHPSAPIAIPAEQEEPQQEPGEPVPGPSASSRGRERSPGGPRRPPKRRTGSSEASPANKRPGPRR